MAAIKLPTPTQCRLCGTAIKMAHYVTRRVGGIIEWVACCGECREK